MPVYEVVYVLRATREAAAVGGGPTARHGARHASGRLPGMVVGVPHQPTHPAPALEHHFITPAPHSPSILTSHTAACGPHVLPRPAAAPAATPPTPPRVPALQGVGNGWIVTKMQGCPAALHSGGACGTHAMPVLAGTVAGPRMDADCRPQAAAHRMLCMARTRRVCQPALEGIQGREAAAEGCGKAGIRAERTPATHPSVGHIQHPYSPASLHIPPQWWCCRHPQLPSAGQ